MKKKFFIIACACSLILSCLPISHVSAYDKQKYWLIGGIYQRRYYMNFDTSTYSYWVNPFRNAFKNWYNTPTKFDFSETTDVSKSVIDCCIYSNANDGANGFTELYWKSSGYTSSPPQENWLYARVWLNRGMLGGTSSAFDSGVAGHEIGHAIGLKHVGGNVLMTTSADGRTVTTPQQDDINGVNSIYKTK